MKEVRLKGTLPRRIEAEKDPAKKTKLEAKLVARLADASFAITVKDVCSAENPTLLEQIETRHATALSDALLAARKKLIPMGDDAIEYVFGDAPSTLPRTMASAVWMQAYVSPEMQRARDVKAKELIAHGVVGGEQTYHALFKLGGKTEGAALLIEAAEAVLAFNRVDEELGEG